MEQPNRRKFLTGLFAGALASQIPSEAKANLKSEGSMPAIDTLVKGNEAFLLELSRFTERHEQDISEYDILSQRVNNFIAELKKGKKTPAFIEQTKILTKDLYALQTHLELSMQIASMMKVGIDRYVREVSVGENIIEVKGKIVVYKADHPKIFDTLLSQANQILQYRHFINESMENLRNFNGSIDQMIEDNRPVFGEGDDIRFG